MLSTLKTYATPDNKFSFSLSYAEEPGGSGTLTVLSETEGVTVDLSQGDLRALSEAFNSASYATIPTCL